MTFYFSEITPVEFWNFLIGTLRGNISDMVMLAIKQNEEEIQIIKNDPKINTFVGWIKTLFLGTGIDTRKDEEYKLKYEIKLNRIKLCNISELD